MRELSDPLTKEDKEWLKNWNKPVPGDDSAESTDESSGEGGYHDWTVPELKEELENRDLPVGGKKDELVARLEADDAEDG